MAASLSHPMVSVNPANRLLTDEQWNTHYPAADYMAKTTRAVTCTLQFLIVLGQPNKTITDLLNKSTAKLYTPDEDCYRLTPFMVATMRGNSHLTAQMIAKAESEGKLTSVLLQQDVFGWTLYHHAAFACENIYKLLSSKRQHSTVPANTLGGLPWDIYVLTNLNLPPRSNENVFFLENGIERLIVEMSPGELREKLRLKTYRSIPYYPPDEVSQLWRSELNSYSFGVVLENEPYKQYLASPPKLIVRKCQEIKEQVPYSLELVADEDIPPGRIVTVYGGKFCSEEENQRTFKETINDVSPRTVSKYPPIYPDEIGNEGQYANCGFPNMFTVNMYGHGTPLILYMSNGIKKGEPIVWNYTGFQALQFEKMHLFTRSRRAMRTYFKGGIQAFRSKSEQIEQRVLQLKEWALNSKEKPKLIDEIQKWVAYELPCIRFPLLFPSAMLDLHYSGILNIKDIYLHFRYTPDYIILNVQKNLSFGPTYHLLFFKCVIEMDGALENDPIGKKQVSEWVLDKIGSLSLFQFAKIFEEIGKFANNGGLKNQEQWSEFLVEQERRFADYDWNADPDSPISLKQRIQYMIKEFASDPSTTLQKLKECILLYEVPLDDLSWENVYVYHQLKDHFYPEFSK